MHLIAHLVVLVVVVVIALVALVVGRRKVLVLVVLIIIHLVVLGLLSRLLEINVLAACPTTATDDVLGRDGLETALAVFFFVYEASACSSLTHLAACYLCLDTPFHAISL